MPSSHTKWIPSGQVRLRETPPRADWKKKDGGKVHADGTSCHYLDILDYDELSLFLDVEQAGTSHRDFNPAGLKTVARTQTGSELEFPSSLNEFGRTHEGNQLGRWGLERNGASECCMDEGAKETGRPHELLVLVLPSLEEAPYRNTPNVHSTPCPSPCMCPGRSDNTLCMCTTRLQELGISGAGYAVGIPLDLSRRADCEVARIGSTPFAPVPGAFELAMNLRLRERRDHLEDHVPMKDRISGKDSKISSTNEDTAWDIVIYGDDDAESFSRSDKALSQRGYEGAGTSCRLLGGKFRHASCGYLRRIRRIRYIDPCVLVVDTLPIVYITAPGEQIAFIECTGLLHHQIYQYSLGSRKPKPTSLNRVATRDHEAETAKAIAPKR
ncbi:hypothetical protein NMY22_g11151 [Coprinellus aureogranulatus]|nr:hypothetical protein NMY22_g11151 [Coprinellus aureogranulatus]